MADDAANKPQKHDERPLSNSNPPSVLNAEGGHHDLRFHKRISFRLARIGVVVAFLLGLSLSSIQVYFDFSNQGRDLDAQIERILSVVERPAARAVHLLDEDLAEEVIQGLMEYEFISEARIVDDLGVPLAERVRSAAQSKTRWITRSIKGEDTAYNITLETAGVRNVAPGKLYVQVDVDTVLTGFFERSLFVLTTGIVRNMILVVLFCLIFYVLLTKPLLSIINSFRNIDPEAPGKDRFSVAKSHDADELGLLVKSGNEFLDSNMRHLAERNEAQEKLRQANNDLERRVEERTAALQKEISERRQIEETLQEMNLRLEQIVEGRTRELKAAKEMAEFASRSKSQFLANMSHELRTPLNAIIGFSRIMKDQMFGPIGVDKYLEYSDDILTSSTHLLSVIGDILDVSKIEAGELSLEKTEVHMSEVAHVCKSLLNEPIHARNLSLDINIPESFPPIFADELRVKQIVINLFSNAVKFTPEGGAIWIEGTQNEDHSSTFKIIDTGIGISESDIPRVLEPFGQVDDIMTRSHEGTGLGLSLCKSFMEEHEGTLEIESTLGKGTTISLWFPAGVPGEDQISDHEA